MYLCFPAEMITVSYSDPGCLVLQTALRGERNDLCGFGESDFLKNGIIQK